MLGIFLDRITHAVVAFLLDSMIPLYRELSQGSLLFPSYRLRWKSVVMYLRWDFS